jgi:hypothetical protein
MRNTDIRQQCGIEIVQWVEEYTDRMKQPRVTRGSQVDCMPIARHNSPKGATRPGTSYKKVVPSKPQTKNWPKNKKKKKMSYEEWLH